MSFFEVIQYLGIGAFAVSGALSGMQKKLDPFGVLIISFVTATGGGTIRDIMLTRYPVWMQSTQYLYIILVSALFAMIFRYYLNYLKQTLFLFDTIGLGIFTIIGIEIGLEHKLDLSICILLGVITGSFGGVLRDILCNDVPVLFQKEIYAVASILGGSFFLLLRNQGLEKNWVYWASALLIMIIRLISVRYAISLPAMTEAKSK